MFEDAERQLHEFAHGGAQSGPLGVAPRQQPLVQRLDVRVMADGHNRRPVQRRSGTRRAGSGAAGTAVQAAARLTFDRDQTEERGDLIGGRKIAAAQHGQQPPGG